MLISNCLIMIIYISKYHLKKIITVKRFFVNVKISCFFLEKEFKNLLVTTTCLIIKFNHLKYIFINFSFYYYSINPCM